MRLFVVDRAPSRAAVRRAVEGSGVEVVGEAGCGEIALQTAGPTAPDVVLVERDLPGMSGLDLVRELGPQLPAARLVMLAVSRDRCDLLDALGAGAAGYLDRRLTPTGLVRSVLAVAAGEMAIPRRLAGDLALEAAERRLAETAHPALDQLSSREIQVLRSLAVGRTDREIATSLGIGCRTVETHVRNILRKLDVPNRATAAARYRPRVG